jgi:type 1 fimbriae regulatory protein FimB/type 1 fimbriae regulatory protein FimE
LIERAGVEAAMPFKVYPHVLHHTTDYVLANKGTDTRKLQGYLGHRSILFTVNTKWPPERFNETGCRPIELW